MAFKITIFYILNVSVKKVNSKHEQMKFLQINGTHKKKTKTPYEKSLNEFMKKVNQQRK